MSDVVNARQCDTCKTIYEDKTGGAFFAKIKLNDVLYEDFCPECRSRIESMIENLIKTKGNAIVYR